MSSKLLLLLLLYALEGDFVGPRCSTGKIQWNLTIVPSGIVVVAAVGENQKSHSTKFSQHQHH